MKLFLHKALNFFLLACPLTLVAAGTTPTTRTRQLRRPPTQRQANELDAIPDGLWTSSAYGLLFNVSNGSVTALSETGISCIFYEGLEESIQDFQVDGDVLSVQVGTIVPYYLDRVESPKAGCADGLTPRLGDEGYTRDPLATFDIVDQSFVEHYAFFALREIDWETATTEARSTLTANSTDEELFYALVSILGPLQDGHVLLNTGDFIFDSYPWELEVQLVQEWYQQDSSSDLDTYVFLQLLTWFTIIDDYMEGGLQGEFGGFVWGRFKDANVGYMLFPNFEAEDVNAFQAQVDVAFLAVADTETIIFDVRINPGGFDVQGLFVASHCTSEPVLAFTKRTKDGTNYTDAEEVYIGPGAPDNTYNGKAIVITSGSTVSAGETFTLAMAQLPQTTILGRHTSGALSDAFLRPLPNGWFFAFSSEEYAAPDGAVYEMSGIPPDDFPTAELLPLSEREAGIDSWLALALETATATDSTPSPDPTQAPDPTPSPDSTPPPSGALPVVYWGSLWSGAMLLVALFN